MTPLPQSRLNEIRGRCEKATHPDWVFDSDRNPTQVTSRDHVICKISPQDDFSHGFTLCQLNLNFIAHARQDIPDLLREIDRLRAENERLTKVNEPVTGEPNC